MLTQHCIIHQTLRIINEQLNQVKSNIFTIKIIEKNVLSFLSFQ